MYEVHMSPALNTQVQQYDTSNSVKAIEIHDGIIFNFNPGLSRVSRSLFKDKLVQTPSCMYMNYCQFSFYLSRAQTHGVWRTYTTASALHKTRHHGSEKERGTPLKLDALLTGKGCMVSVEIVEPR